MSKEIGKHGFSGSYRPELRYPGFTETFSVGIFEWVPTSSGKGAKKGAVKVRVRGLSSNPDGVYEVARKIAAELDEGAYKGPKNVKVGNV